MLDIHANFIGLVVQFQGISIQWTATAWRANSLHQRNNKRFEALFLEYLLPCKFAWISLMFSTFLVRQTTNFAIASTNGSCLSRQQTFLKLFGFCNFLDKMFSRLCCWTVTQQDSFLMALSIPSPPIHPFRPRY